MAQQIINVGTLPNDGTGDPLRTSQQKSNANFTELYALINSGGITLKTVGGQSLLGTGNVTEVQNSLTASSILAPSVDTVISALNSKENTIIAGTTLEYFRGDKTFQTLNTAVIPELTNLYFTNARGIGSVLTGYVSGAGTIAATDTVLQAIQKLNGNDQLRENTIVAGTTAQYWRGDKSWQTLNTTAVAEGTNLYFTNARVLSSVLTGYTAGSNTALAATDTVLAAMGKIQGQITARVSNATHTGDATGATVLTLATVNTNVGSFGTASSVPQYTVNAKGLTTASTNVPIVITQSQVTSLVTDLAAKQPAISGTANYLTKFGAGGVVQSQIFDNGTNVGIGTTNPYAKVHIIGGGVATDITTSITNSSFRLDVANPAKSIILGYTNNNGLDNSFVQCVNSVTNNPERLVLNPFGGNSLFGTTVDNGSLVQVNGNITANAATLANQVVIKSQLDAFVPTGTVNLTGNQTIVDTKTFNNTTNPTSLSLINGGVSGGILTINNSNTLFAVTGTQSGSSGQLIRFSAATGNNSIFSADGQVGNTGNLFSGLNNGTLTFSVKKEGNVTANSFIKSGGTSSESLMADGSVLSVLSGTYTPTYTNSVNTSIVSVDTHRHSKIGNLVTVYGSIQVSLIAASGTSQFSITLPFNRTTTTAKTFGFGSVSGLKSTEITGVELTSNSLTTVVITHTNSATGNKTFYYSFSYLTTE